MLLLQSLYQLKTIILQEKENYAKIFCKPIHSSGRWKFHFATLSKVHLEIIWYDMSLSLERDVFKTTALTKYYFFH